MNFEEQTEQPSLEIKGLGESAYEAPKQALPQEEDNAIYFGRPEYYDYSDIELPENYDYDQDLLNEFNELAAKYNLSQKGANELMSMAVRLTKLTGDNLSQAMAEQLSYDLSIKLDDLSCNNLKPGHLIDKEDIKPVFLRMDSELADKGKGK